MVLVVQIQQFYLTYQQQHNKEKIMEIKITYKGNINGVYGVYCALIYCKKRKGINENI